MLPEQKPLVMLTIGEFSAIVKDLVEQTLTEKMQALAGEPQLADEEMTIQGLMTFLHCSKPSVHNYKKNGLPFYRVGRKVLFRKSEVLDFMKTLKRQNKRLS